MDGQYRLKDKATNYIIAICILLVLPFWYLLVVPNLKRLPNHFTYSADILSVDNFYDPATGKFLGEHISKTLFSYKVMNSQGNILTVINSFAVKTLNNKPIFTVVREYYIDPYNLQHKIIIGKKERGGYLFAPRYLSKQPFQYWHVNYDLGVQLRYIATEKVHGLTVYHYEAYFSADQTRNLAHLKDVPETKGIITKVKLQLWLEPISGWLVKYSDEANAYYYDQATKKILYPWNTFSNQYTQTSIDKEALIASKLKWKIITIDFIIPIILLFIALGFFLSAYFENAFVNVYRLSFKKILQQTAHLYVYTIVFVVGIVFFLLIHNIYNTHYNKKVNTIGISLWQKNNEGNKILNGFRASLAEAGFKEGHNLELIVYKPTNEIKQQIKVIQSFARRHVDLILALSTPNVLVAKGVTSTIPIIFANVIYPLQFGVVDSLRHSNNNLVGVRNYVSPAEQFNRFEKFFPEVKSIGFVHHKGDPDSEVQYQEFKTMLNDRGITLSDIEAIDGDDLQKKINNYKFVDALYIACDTFMQGQGGDDIVIGFASQHKIPTFTCSENSIEKGVLLGYIIDSYTIGRLLGMKAALILNGAEPSWIKTESPNDKHLLINKKTQENLQVKVPNELNEHYYMAPQEKGTTK